jgi:cytochrome d ubiquinol oxidase subunit II
MSFTWSASEWLLIVMLAGLAAYALFGGADFGAGLWHLLAGRGVRGRDVRYLVEHAIGPVWEANHVWLIFVIVLFWTGFPSVFAAVMSTLYIPLTLVALGIIFRGAAFAFRKASTERWQRAVYGAVFAAASVLTPFFLGAAGGAVASGRVPPGIAEGDLLSSWWNPTSIFTGLLAVGVTAYLAAVYLTADARRLGQVALAEAFRRRAIVTGVAVGVLAAAGLLVVRSDAPHLWAGLTHRGLGAVAVSVAAGLASLCLLLLRQYVLVRVTAATAVVALLAGWALAQWPYLLPGVTVADAAATPAVLHATLWVLAGGGVLLVPSLVALFTVFQRPVQPAATPTPPSGRPDPGQGRRPGQGGSTTP